MLNGPRPAEASTRCASWRPTARSSSRATPTSPSPTSTTPPRSRGCDEVPAGARRGRASGRTTQLGDEQLDWLRRLPAERRVRVGDDARPRLPRLAGQPDAGLRRGPRPVDRPSSASRAPTRGSSCCGHTHVAGRARAGPEAHRQPRRVRLRLRRRPGRVLGAAHHRRRATTSRPRRPSCIATAVRRRSRGRARSAARGLPGDVYRAATDPHREARPMSVDRRRRAGASSSPGMGAVTPLGNDVATFWARLVAGESGVRTIESFDPSRVDSQDRRRGASTSTRRPSSTARRCGATTATPSSALVADARGDGPGRPAGPARGRRCAERTGVHHRLRASAASSTLFEQIADHRRRAARTGLSPFFIPMAIANIGVGPGRHQLRRARARTSRRSAPAPPAATRSARRARSILRGDADMMLAGGSEAAIHEAVVGGFAAMRALSTRNDDPEGASRPFDKGRDGFVIAEGAGDARARGARPRARRAAPRILAELVRLRRDRRRDPHHAARARRRGRASAPRGARSRRPASTRPRSTTSTPTPPRRPRATAPSSQAITTLLGEHAPQVCDHRHQERHRPHARRRRRRSTPVATILAHARRLRAADAQPRPTPTRASATST